MSDLSDVELRNELPWLEGSILAAMRTWVLGCRRGIPTDASIETVFANLRAPEAAGHLHRLMNALSNGCTRMINVYCTCEPVMSEDEVLLLDVFAMMQEQRHEAATNLLQRLVVPATAQAASGAALAIVQLLNTAGNVIARGPSAARRHEQDLERCFAPGGVPRRLH